MRREAADDAERYSVGHSPPSGIYQHGDAGDVAADIVAAAAVVVATSAQWIVVAAQIECIRRGAKRAIAGAQDATAIESVLAHFSCSQIA